MSQPLVLVTGFGPFPGVTENPSLAVARALELAPPPGVRVVARELPVTFEGAPRAVGESVADLERTPAVLLGLGVQPDSTFRLERRARGRLEGGRADNEGRTASAVGVDGGPDLETSLDLGLLEEALRAAGAPEVTHSGDAGSYVCERTYHALLMCGAGAGVPALFLHLPPAEVLASAQQVPIVRALVAALVRQTSSSSRGRSSAD